MIFLPHNAGYFRRIWLAGVVFYLTIVSCAGQSLSGQIFTWQELPVLDVGLEGAFFGAVGQAVVVAGGVKDASNYRDTIQVLYPDSDAWIPAGQLPEPMAYGVVAKWNDALLLVGGRNTDGVSAQVVLLRWDDNANAMKTEPLPPLPEKHPSVSAAVMDNVLYVMADTCWQLDLGNAEKNPPWRKLELPENFVARIGAIVICQFGGEKDCLFILGGQTPDGKALPGGWRYAPSARKPQDRWQPMADFPLPDVTLSGPIAAPAGVAHIVLAVPEGRDAAARTTLWFYHTITNTWTTMQGASLPSGAANFQAGPAGPISLETTSRATVIRRAELVYEKKGFGFWNYFVLCGYMMVLILVGVYFSRRGKNTNDYFLAGQRIPWWAAGLSIYATGFSALSFMSMPAKVYATDWAYFLGSMALIPVIIFTIYCFVPFVCQLKVTTAYEYLERRFNLPVRLFCSLTFILFQLGRMSIMTLLPALALATVTGIDVSFCILTMGALCIIYTVLGGIEAIIWNDCLQVLVMTGAIVAILLAVLFKVEGGVSELVQLARADEKFTAAYWTWDYTVASVWVVFFGNILSNFAPYVTDQSIIQRYLTTSDMKRSQRALWFNVWFLVPNAFMFFLVGTAIYVFYKAHPAMLHPAIQTDAILPLFVVQNLPYGLCGLVIAGIFAASMSSLDSSMHAVTTAVVTDWIRRFRPGASDRFYFILARIMTFFIGVVGTAIAMLMAVLQIPSLLDVFFRLLGLLGGGIAGIFLLGLLTRRSHGGGVFIGALISAAAVFVCQTYTRMHFFLYGAVGLLVSMSMGYLLSLLLPSRKDKNLSNLTIYTMER